MNGLRNYDAITAAQAEGIPCKHCGFPQGHKVSCPTINNTVPKTAPVPLEDLSISDADKALLSGMHIKW